MHTGFSTNMVSIREIVSWQFPGLFDLNPNDIFAVLPALQRGAVWRPRQIEAFWDSFMRGFPIGSFILSRYNEQHDSTRTNRTSKDISITKTHYLLDGQQRARAIALGFYDFTNTESITDGLPSLWIDLAPPTKADDERAFIFRVLTRSHPWGYGRDNPESRLPVSSIRDALKAWGGKRPSELKLADAWPWDAVAPVPVYLLMDVIRKQNEEHNIGEDLKKRLQTLPYWRNDASVNLSGQAIQQNVLAILENSENYYFQWLVAQLKRISPWKSTEEQLKIPALVMADTTKGLDTSFTKLERIDVHRDELETMFIRVNAGGTPLSGEELMYSILKSVMPEVADLTENIPQKFVPNSRLVLLATRLILAESEQYINKVPPQPSIARFRQLIHESKNDGDSFQKKLKNFITEKARSIFKAATDLLTGDANITGEKFYLPATLAADLARGSRVEVFLLFLRWIQLMDKYFIDHSTALNEHNKRRVLGAITLLAWYSTDCKKSVEALWSDLQQCEESRLPTFFEQKDDNNRSIIMKAAPALYPVFPPSLLECLVKEIVFSDDLFENNNENFWSKWSFFHDFSNKHTECTKLNIFLENKFNKSEYATSERVNTFIEKIVYDKRLILYAQRQWLHRWFPDYNPLHPDQIEDTDRPWDYDHIMPYRHFYNRKSVPNMIRILGWTIGNFRAWPLEANRSDQDDTPVDKLSSVDDNEMNYEGIRSPEEEREASFIDDENWQYWKLSSPEGVDVSAGGSFFAKPESEAYRAAFVKAVLLRIIRIYKEWHDSLEINELI